MYQDLHVHTATSDGLMNYQGLLDACVANNISTVAFADHDMVPNEKSLVELDKLRDHKTKWILGVEMSSGCPKEIGDINLSQFHIVGLFIDPKNQDLVERGKIIVKARIERMKKMVKNIVSLGFDLTEDECLLESKGEVVQRPHIVAALLKKEKNIAIIKRLVTKFKKAADKDEKLRENYNNMVKQMEAEAKTPYRQPVYQIFLSEDAFIKGIYVKKGGTLDFDSTVELIRKAGGLAILAHWSESRSKFPIEAVEKIFKEGRIDGAEIVYDLYRIRMGEEEELRQEQTQIKRLVDKYRLLASGGSDAHSEEALVYFSKTEWFAKQTIGLAEKMIEKEAVFKGWSTIK